MRDFRLKLLSKTLQGIETLTNKEAEAIVEKIENQIKEICLKILKREFSKMEFWDSNYEWRRKKMFINPVLI